MTLNLYSVLYLFVGMFAGFVASWLSVGPYASLAVALNCWRDHTEPPVSFVSVVVYACLFGALMVAFVALSGFDILFIIGLLLGLYAGFEAGKDLIEREVESLSNSLTVFP